MNMQTKAHRTLLAVSFALVAILASAIPVAAQSSHFSLRMENHTGYDIRVLRVSSVSDPNWGRDILGTSILEYGSSFTVTNIPPGYYDIKFVDQDRDVCVLHNVAIFSDLNWTLSQTWLLSCEQNS
jgi:hypothetical protein